MPRLDGVTMVEQLRVQGDQTPVLFLSALGEIQDRVSGLKAGGDDYLVKPYALAELIARVEALARRRETGSVQTVLQGGELEMDLIGREVRRAGQENRPATARIPTTRIPHAPRRPIGHPHDAARKGLGIPFRSADERYRCPHFPS